MLHLSLVITCISCVPCVPSTPQSYRLHKRSGWIPSRVSPYTFFSPSFHPGCPWSTTIEGATLESVQRHSMRYGFNIVLRIPLSSTMSLSDGTFVPPPGTEHDNRSAQLRTFVAVMATITVVSICLRFWSRSLGNGNDSKANARTVRRPPFWWDDWAALTTVVRFRPFELH